MIEGAHLKGLPADIVPVFVRQFISSNIYQAVAETRKSIA
jgi:hypothetical protein